MSEFQAIGAITEELRPICGSAATAFRLASATVYRFEVDVEAGLDSSAELAGQVPAEHGAAAMMIQLALNSVAREITGGDVVDTASPAAYAAEAVLIAHRIGRKRECLEPVSTDG